MNNASDIKHIYYINLDKRPDRRSHFENQMKMLKWDAIRFPAIENSIGALGCSLSHLKLLEYAKNNKLDHILIMEDDIAFLNPLIFIDSLNKFLSSKTEFDVLLIAGNNMGEYRRENENCVQVTHCQTTTGYLVRNNYFDTLIDNYKNGIYHLSNNIGKLNSFAIDQYWSKLQQTDKWFLLTPLTVTQKPDYSDIEKRPINYTSAMLDLDKTAFLQRRRDVITLKNIKSLKF
jgi:glycosyl transferase family 25